jgi:thiamine pyrophosphokinase
MIPAIVHDIRPVTLVGGGQVNPEALNTALRLAPILVAADGGAGRALGVGRVPDFVIGDLDSLDPSSIAQIPQKSLHRICEQDSTDFDKCLRSIDAPLVLATGFTGGRLDHELAVYNALVRHHARRCIVTGETDLCFVVPQTGFAIGLPEGARVSLFPMGPVRVSASGLRWNFRGLEMAPDGAVGTSNAATGGMVRIGASVPKLLMILPVGYLEPVMKALTGGVHPR